MRRVLALLALFVASTGFDHHHHHHHGRSGGGCGGNLPEEPSSWVVAGTVELHEAEPQARARITVRDARTAAPVHGANVTVGETVLTEAEAGTYVGGVDALNPGEPVTISARGAHSVTVSGQFPNAAANLRVEGSPATVGFDERGAATAITVVAHGATGDARSEVMEFEEDARLELPVPEVEGLREVEVQITNEISSSDGRSHVELEADASARVTQTP